MLAAPHLHNPLTLLRFAVPAAPATLATVTTRPHVSPQPPPGFEKYAHLCASHGVPVKAAPLRPRLCTSIPVTLPQPHVSTTQVGTHPVRSAATLKRSSSTALAGTHNPVGVAPRAGTGPFPKPRALVLPMVKFGKSKSDRLGHIDTVDSDLMHHQFRFSFFSGIQARRAEILLTSSPLPVASFMRLFSKKPVIMFRTSPISSGRTLTTWTSLSCSTRTPSSPTPLSSLSPRHLPAKTRGGWWHLVVRPYGNTRS